MAAPTIENGSGNGEYSNSNTVSVTVTAGNRLAVCVFSETGETHDSVVYGAAALSQIGTTVQASSGGSFVNVSWWELANPSAGTANVVATTSGGTTRIGVQAYSLVGAGAAQATRGTDSSIGNDTTASCTFTVDANDSLVLDALAVGNANLVPVADVAQTEHRNANSGGGTVADRCRCASSSKVSAAGPATMTWDMSSASSLRHAMIAVAFPPSIAPAGGGGVYYRRRRSTTTGGRGL